MEGHGKQRVKKNISFFVGIINKFWRLFGNYVLYIIHAWQNTELCVI